MSIPILPLRHSSSPFLHSISFLITCLSFLSSEFEETQQHLNSFDYPSILAARHRLHSTAAKQSGGIRHQRSRSTATFAPPSPLRPQPWNLVFERILTLGLCLAGKSTNREALASNLNFVFQVRKLIGQDILPSHLSFCSLFAASEREKMHGRPRKALEAEEEVESASKAAELRTLQSQFLNNHHNKIYDKEALGLSAKLVEINPELYTAWNYRKLAVNHHLSQSDSEPELVQTILNEELRVVECALRQNPKAYGAWYHRKWVLSKGHSSIDYELKLLLKFQKIDSRNFHAWNYRRFVAALKNISDEDELKYTTDMIEKNLSNYSAWHNRSILLSNLIKQRAEGFFPKEKILSDEYELVHQAIFTDPEDQSAWFYHLWLLEQTVNSDAPFLVSSWPFPGSELHVSASSSAGGVLPSFSSHCFSGMIPIVLCFNQAVKHVDSSAITLNSIFVDNKDVVWKPLSENNCHVARVWFAILDTSGVKIDPSETYPVEVGVSDPHRIVSFNGFELSHSFCYKFVLRFKSVINPAKKQMLGPISWEDYNFKKCENEVEESYPVPSSTQLSTGMFRLNGACEWQMDILANEINLLRELLLESNCKIGKLTLARLLTAFGTMTRGDNAPSLYWEDVMGLYSDLMKSDPPHVGYYKDEYSLTLLRQVTSSRDSLLRYCWLYKASITVEDEAVICMRLNNLKLSRIGSIEHFLWVQMLDLSHNELGTIEGFEAMQLLSWLNLSYNKFKSFTALAPVRRLRSLRVLNISHNKIGEHNIDTTRYLFPSPLSHTKTTDLKFDEVATDGINMAKYWEAYLLLNGLDLTQLDIRGNATVDEDFMLFLQKILPSLKWLDNGCMHEL